MKDIQNLLSQVAIISKKNDEILDATGGRFNMFRMCGVNHYENTHSAIIAEFLNPNGTHGLKSKLLKCFIETLGNDFTIENFNYENARVRTEHHTDLGRIDIFIEDNQNKAIIIENKVYAGDQWEQLKRYNEYAEAKYKKGNYQIFYLTLYGEEASEQSGKGVSYIPISYEKNIIAWLEKCVAIASRFPIVRETIIQYINHIKQLTNQDMDTKNKEEIIEILSNIDNLKAAKVISQNYSATFDLLTQKYFVPKMEEFARNKELEFGYYGTSTETFIYFELELLKKRNDKFYISFYNDAGSYFYGLFYDANNLSEENKNLLQTKLKNLGLSSRPGGDGFCAKISNLSLDSWENDIIKNPNFFKDCKDKIEKLLTAMEAIEW
jgi:hypothetical protein